MLIHSVFELRASFLQQPLGFCNNQNNPEIISYYNHLQDNLTKQNVRNTKTGGL
jgi:hypothetical protein